MAVDIIRRGGGRIALERQFAAMLRSCIDDVIMTPKTGRRSYDELEKTEKTYIGTRVEIDLRAMLHLPKGRLDTVILGRDVDIKNTMGSTWMIPGEAVDHPCILVAADETRALCYLGLTVCRPGYLTPGQNRDAKKSISATGFDHILWVLKDQPYPANFWRAVPGAAVARIFACTSGNRRMATLFREVQRVPIHRYVVEAVARQQDFMRRIRSDNGRGARDILAAEGIALLSGQYDGPLIRAFGLPPCPADAFVSCRADRPHDFDVAATHGLNLFPALPRLL